MHVEVVIVGEFEVNCLIVRGETADCFVVDPGADAPRILEVLAHGQLRVEAYLMTHGHVDHVSALAEVHAVHPAPVLCHAADLAWAFSEDNALPPFYGAPRRPAGEVRTIGDGDAFTAAGTPVRVIATPGHTPGSVCFYLETAGLLLTGDTLFAGSAGRTDLPGGNARALADSLAKLVRLPNATRVYAGHGPASTIGREKRTNYFMREIDR